MNGTVGVVIVAFLTIWAMKGCLMQRRPVAPQQTQTEQTNVYVTAEAKDGLALPALIGLSKEVKNAEEFERRLNTPGGINNLDLNEDNKVDYLKVTEYGTEGEAAGFSLTTEILPGEEQEVASIEFVKTADSVLVQARGNEQIYGQNYYHRGGFGLTEMLLMGYLFSPHSLFRSPFGYGAYPSYYSPFAPSGSNSYRSRVRPYGAGVNRATRPLPEVAGKNLQNPGLGKSASRGITRPLSNPTSTQRAFQARNPSKSVRSGGFGRATNQSSQSRFGSRTGAQRSSGFGSNRSARSFRSSGGFGGFGK